MTTKSHFVYSTIIALLLAVIAAMGYKFLVAGKTVTVAADNRTAIVLEPAERALILQEMRGFLGVVQTVTAALSQEQVDMLIIARAARGQGMAAAGAVPPTLAAKLPLEFKTLGHSVHSDFDRIALDAEDLKDAGHTLKQLSDTLSKCVACHATYQIAGATPK